VDVAALVALAEDLERLVLRDQAAVDIAVTVHGPGNPGLADEDADVDRLAALLAAHRAADAVDDRETVRALDDRVARDLVGDDGLRQRAEIEVLREGDELLGVFKTHDLCVVGVGHDRGDVAVALVDGALDELVDDLVFDAARLLEIVRLRQIVVEGRSHIIDVKGNVAHIELGVQQLAEAFFGAGEGLCQRTLGLFSLFGIGIVHNASPYL